MRRVVSVRRDWLGMLLFFLLATIAAITLLVMGKVSNLVRIFTLVILFSIFGIFFGIHPSPLCALTKSLTIYKINGFIPPPMIVAVRERLGVAIGYDDGAETFRAALRMDLSPGLSSGNCF